MRINNGQNRREFLVTATALATQLGAEAIEVPWLADVQKTPAKVPFEKLGYFAPLLEDAEGKPITTLDAWQKKRREIRADWMKFLGPMPARPKSNEFKVLREDQVKGCVRQLIRYECERDLFVEAYLLRPVGKSERKRPGIVALHPTTRDTIDAIAGIVGPESKQLGLKLAQHGFVVICPRNFLWQDVKQLNDAMEKHRRRHPKALGMHKMLYDARRATDILAGLPDVDAKRIGATGHSLGGKETLYLTAFDERIRAGVASEGGTGFRSTNWDAPWYLGPAIRDLKFPLNHHQLIALAAPRAFLILAGENSSPAASDGDRTWPFIEAALPVCRLYGHPARLGMYNHRKGHSIPPLAFERMAEWLKTYLA